MSQFTISIPDVVRKGLTVAPPPMWDRRTGVFVPYGEPVPGRYADLAIVKAGNVVYVDEELDVYEHPGSHSHYRMMIRRFPWREDLQLILAAARHMLLIGEYQFEYETKEGLSPDMECGFWDVKYVLPKVSMMADGDTSTMCEPTIPYAMRKRIWQELFSAIGHKVKWGGSVMNVRRRKA